jgi:hypothetical protein
MSYAHIDNLYKDKRILSFRRCYALEKVHGTSAHIGWKNGVLSFFSGGASHAQFVALFDHGSLTSLFTALVHPEVTVYGEAYGGKMQGMRETYGPDLRFIAFDVKIGSHWLDVPDMDQVVRDLGIEVVPWEETSTDIEALDALRDKPSEVAVRRGCGERPREGIVLRPSFEVTLNSGERVCAKHKGEGFQERGHQPKVQDATKLAVLEDAEAAAKEWVTEMRLGHVLDKLPGVTIVDMPRIIKAMVEDVYREGAGEVVESKATISAIGKRTAALFKARLQASLHESP